MPATEPLSQHVRDYETIYILRPTTQPGAAEKCAQRIAEVIDREKGKLTKVDNWGKRQLAYPIERHSRGIFVHLRYLGQGGLVQELERNLRLVDDVIRFQTIVLGAGPEIADVAVDEEAVKFIPVEADDGNEVQTVEERLGLPTFSERRYDRDDSRGDAFTDPADDASAEAQADDDTASDEGKASTETTPSAANSGTSSDSEGEKS
ncbi:MAG: 30S ribosomal protein S6 [Myxococcales bacterium]|nr:30S ribosomal protein S6 [Myxococcales bacterium]